MSEDQEQGVSRCILMGLVLLSLLSDPSRSMRTAVIRCMKALNSQSIQGIVQQLIDKKSLKPVSEFSLQTHAMLRAGYDEAYAQSVHADDLALVLVGLAAVASPLSDSLLANSNLLWSGLQGLYASRALHIVAALEKVAL